MNPSLYPLRFEPQYQYRLWGGRRLSTLLSAPMPDGPIGEAWLLSDREANPSVVAEGPLKGRTIAQLTKADAGALLGKLEGRFDRFPLLLKFLDATEVLSVQVHPSDEMTTYLPPGESGKTEAWIVLETGPEARIFAGLRPGTKPEDLENSLAEQKIADYLSSFRPDVGDGVLLPAGTVHTLRDLVVFEVQENSDVTFRLSDWDRADPEKGKPRLLQVQEALACIDYNKVALAPVVPVWEEADPVVRQRMFSDKHFGLWRMRGKRPFTVGAANTPQVLVCLGGAGELDYKGDNYVFGKGDVMLLPAVVGECACQPSGEIELLEISLPEGEPV